MANTPGHIQAIHHGTVHLMLHPIMPLWLLAIVFLGAVALIIYLYQQQRDLASPRIILWLTAIRLALLLLPAIALLGPTLQWTRIEKSPGQLWLVLDHSKSMGVQDAQGGNRYALRWACALGLVPGYHDALDRDLAKLSALEQQLRGLNDRQSQFASSSTGQALRQQRENMAQLRNWLSNLKILIATLSADDAGSGVTDQLKQATKAADHAIQAATTDASAGNAAANTYAATDVELQDAMRALQIAATNADQTYISAHRSDVALKAALNHVYKQTRAQLALAILTRKTSRDVVSIGRLMHQDDVHIVSFAGTAFTTPYSPYTDPSPILQSALNPSGNSTNISQALLTTASRIEQGRRADVLLVSDGRQNVGSEAGEIARLLAIHHVRTYTLCIGSDHSPPTASIDSIDAPQWIYKHQYLKATAIIHLRSLADKPVTVELLRAGQVEARQVLLTHRNDAYKSTEFKDLPPGPGVYPYTIRIVPAATMHRAVTRLFRLTVRRDKMQMLLIANQPDWNYQYLVNYYSRNKRVHLQAVLLHPAEIAGIAPPPPVTASLQNPSYLAQRLPVGRKAWEAFDVIILGDIPGNTLSAKAQQGISYAIRTKGTALVLLAGREYMPQDWASQPLAKLFPIQFNTVWPSVLLQQQNDTGFQPALTPQGAESGLSQLGVDPSADSAIWRSMPRWYWHSAYTMARTDARVLWMIAGDSGSAADNSGSITGFQAARRRALLATMSVGAGRVMYLASNQLWRLRYVNGANIEDVILGQLLRWASGSQLPAGGKYVRFGTNRTNYDQGRQVEVHARILNDQLLPQSDLQFQALATSLAATTAPSTQTSAQNSLSVFSARMISQAGVPGYYTGILTGLPPGRYRITLKGSDVNQRMLNDPTASVRNLTIRIKSAGNLELQDSTSDPVAMEQIARAGNGVALTGPYADILAGYMPPTKQVLKIPENTGLFLHPKSQFTFWLHIFFLLIFLGLITAEWLIRKTVGMV